MLQMPSRSVLSLSDVVKTFPGVVALGGVSLNVVEGEVLFADAVRGRRRCKAHKLA